MSSLPSAVTPDPRRPDDDSPSAPAGVAAAPEPQSPPNRPSATERRAALPDDDPTARG